MQISFFSLSTVQLIQLLSPARLAAALRQASHRQHVADLQQRLAELVTEREALDRDIVATACKLLRQRGGGTQAATDTIYPPLPTGAEQ